MKMFLSFIYIL